MSDEIIFLSMWLPWGVLFAIYAVCWMVGDEREMREMVAELEDSFDRLSEKIRVLKSFACQCSIKEWDYGATPITCRKCNKPIET